MAPRTSKRQGVARAGYRDSYYPVGSTRENRQGVDRKQTGDIVKDAAGTPPDPANLRGGDYHSSVVKNLKDLHHNGKK